MRTTWERFKGKFRRDFRDCWIPKVIHRDGRSQFRFGGETRLGSSVTFEVMSGRRLRMGDKTELSYKCQNTVCWNPFHLWEVSSGYNITVRMSYRKVYYCLRGHPYDTENTYVSPKGKRRCRECQRMRGRSR